MLEKKSDSPADTADENDFSFVKRLVPLTLALYNAVAEACLPVGGAGGAPRAVNTEDSVLAAMLLYKFLVDECDTLYV